MAEEVLNMPECLKFNVNETFKLLYKLDGIYKRQAHSELYQTYMTELLRKCLI